MSKVNPLRSFLDANYSKACLNGPDKPSPHLHRPYKARAPHYIPAIGSSAHIMRPATLTVVVDTVPMTPKNVPGGTIQDP